MQTHCVPKLNSTKSKYRHTNNTKIANKTALRYKVIHANSRVNPQRAKIQKHILVSMPSTTTRK